MKRIFLLLIVIALMNGCSIFQKDSFEGAWEMNLSGSIDEKVEFSISPQNTFDVKKVIPYGSVNYEVNFKGTVSKDGVIVGDIFADRGHIGTLQGTVNYETGSGKWNASMLSGVWNAVKK
jgi:hypothetical protein